MEGCYIGDLTLHDAGFSFSYGEEENEALQGNTTITGNGEEVILERTNEHDWTIRFVEGVEDHSQYTTPYGEIPAKVTPDIVKYDISSLGGSVNLVYGLEFQGGSPIKINFLAELETVKE